jgi:hypothetical protein
MTTTPENENPHPLREPCRRCGWGDGILLPVNGQDTVRCAKCNRHCYNAPRSETGRERRSVSTRPSIRPSQRSRILVRDSFACIFCHRTDLPLDIGHLVSVHDGHIVGMSDADLACDGNLATMCAPCNSGQGRRSLPPALLAAAIWAWQRNSDDENGGQRKA